MKFVIFCLLAVCAFKAVFAETLTEKIKKIHKDYADQMHQSMDPIVDTYNLDVMMAKRNQKYDPCRDGCKESAVTAIQKNFNDRLAKLDKCRDNAIKDKNLKFATDCSNKCVLNFSKVEQEVPASVHVCIQKCGD